MKNRPAQLERRLRDSIALFPQSRAVADGILWRNYFTGVSPPTGTGLSDEKRQVKNCIVWVQMGVLQCSSAHTSNPPSWTVVVVKVEVAKNGYNTSLYNKKTSLMCFHGLLAALSEQSDYVRKDPIGGSRGARLWPKMIITIILIKIVIMIINQNYSFC